MAKLTLKQKKFADEYIISGNIEQSAINAGYSANYARSQSHKLLANVGIKSYIDERLAKLESEKIATQEEVLQYLTSVMRGEKTESLLVLDGEGTQKVIEMVPNVQARTRAAELLGKRYGTFTDRVDINAQIASKPKFDDIVSQLGGSGLDE
nr:MAG TPA: Terminase small subunit [Caudoviricetes sp.]